MVSERVYETFEPDEMSWILSAAQASEISFVSRIKAMLQHFAGGSPPFKAICEASDRINNLYNCRDFNAAFVGDDATLVKVFDTNCTSVSGTYQWQAFKKLLLTYCPPSTVSEEEKLKRIRRRRGETWSNFASRFVCEASTNGSSTQNKAKTLYRQLPQNFKCLIQCLPEDATLESMAQCLRRASFWDSETLTQSKEEDANVDQDVMDIDYARCAQATTTQTDRVVRNNGQLNFQAITSPARVMMGAREICRQSRKEANSMMQYLRRLLGDVSQRRQPQYRPQRRNRQAFAVFDANETHDDANELPDETADFEEVVDVEGGCSSVFTTRIAKSVESKADATVLMLPVSLRVATGANRKTEGLIDTGAERTIIAQTLVKELGIEVLKDDSRLIVADGQEVQTAGRCSVKMQLNNGGQDQSFDVECLILPKPGFELLLGFDFMVNNNIVINPRGRFITISQKKHHCKTVGHINKSSIQNRVSVRENSEIGSFLENMQHFPVQQDNRILFPLNRSVMLGPKEKRMLKIPITLKADLTPWRSPTIAPNFSVTLGAQHPSHLNIAVENHKMEPVRLTGKTVIFELAIDPASKAVDAQSIYCPENLPKTALELETQCTYKFPTVISDKIGRFKGWSISASDVSGDLHAIHTKVPYTFGAETAACSKEIQNLLDNNIISRFDGKPKHVIPWFSVPKRNTKERRIVLDFRGLNKLTLRSPAYPMHKDSIVQNLSGKKFFAKFDFKSGFYQVELNKELRPYFTIFLKGQTFAFNRLPMGWINSMAFFDNAVRSTLSKVRDHVLAAKLASAIESYVDDVCIAANSFEELARTVFIFLSTCNNMGWTLSPTKIVWAARKIDFLGFSFSSEGVLPSNDIRTRLANLQPPRSRSELRSCLGVIRTVLRYCRLSSQSLMALQQMTTWSSADIDAYWKGHSTVWKHVLKQLERCWYCRPDCIGDVLHLYVDACKDGYGFALFDASSKRLINLGAGAFCKQAFRSSGQAEAKGLHRALTECRSFLIGRQFTVFTDATVVRQANNQQNVSLLIQKYLDVLNLVAGRLVHIDGVSNVIADLLSRSPYWRSQCEQTVVAAPAQTKLQEEIEDKRSIFPEWFSALPRYLRDGSMPTRWNNIERARLQRRSLQFRLVEGKLQFEVSPEMWVPCCTSTQDISQWLTQAHEDAGHYGIKATQYKLQNMVYFPNLTSFVEKWVRSCHRCQQFARQDPASSQRFTTWQEFNQGIGLDFLGPLPRIGQSQHIVCCVDLCTRWAFIRPAKDTTANSVIGILEDWCHLFGYPDFIQSDNASAFVANSVSKWMSERSIKRRVIPSYSPQCNGAVERINQEIIRRLQRMTTDGNWVKILPQVQALINECPNVTTGVSANEALFGFRPRFSQSRSIKQTDFNLVEDSAAYDSAIAAQRASFAKQKRWAIIDSAIKAQTQRFLKQRHTQPESFAIGDSVLLFDSSQAKLHGQKLHPKWMGPFQITECISPAIYRLKDIQSNSLQHQSLLVHRDKLKKYFNRR